MAKCTRKCESGVLGYILCKDDTEVWYGGIFGSIESARKEAENFIDTGELSLETISICELRKIRVPKSAKIEWIDVE